MSITTKRAAEVLGMAVTFNGCGRATSDELKEAVCAAIDALREKAEREDPKPLTIEELWQMDGEPVYIERIGWRIHHGMQVFMGEYYLYTGENSSINISKNRVNIYRHKPKEVQE